jgi:hypothetical protein
MSLTDVCEMLAVDLIANNSTTYPRTTNLPFQTPRKMCSLPSEIMRMIADQLVAIRPTRLKELGTVSQAFRAATLPILFRKPITIDVDAMEFDPHYRRRFAEFCNTMGRYVR